MRHVPRFALGTIQPSASHELAVWGLVAALSETDDSPLLFRSTFDLSCRDGARAINRRATGHLGSLAKSRSAAISALARAATDRDTAIVEGTFGFGATDYPPARTSLDRLCQWLGLPRIAIVDVRHAATCG